MFVEELEALGGHGVRVGSLEEAREYVLSLAREVGAKLVIRWDEPYLEELGADEPLKEAGVGVSVWGEGEDAREQAARADIGLSTAEYAVAETGSLVVCSGVGAGRSVTLLPPTYVAVVPAGRVVSGVADVIRAYAGRGELPSGLCFHTGPSRSADIEQSLAIGVHGPGDVHVVLVG
ncbi:LutC/YkgG family protein [Rubrobacter taiwanensis]|nr:lactate utilization protein [Rubrobacter taiwanensis]